MPDGVHFASSSECGKIGRMDVKTFSFDEMLEWLRQEASNRQSMFIVEARIAVSRKETKTFGHSANQKAGNHPLLI